MFGSFKFSQKQVFAALLIVLGCVIAWPLIFAGFYTSHDGELHLGRIPAYAHQVFAGQFPVRWSDTLNFRYGSPIFSFMYPLPYLLASGIYGVTASAITALKITMLLTFLASGLAFYSYVYLWKKDELLAFVSAAVYLLLPYRMLTIYTRVAFGEAVAFLFPPLIMLGSLYLKRKEFKKGILVTALSVAGLILSHNAMSLIFVGPLFLWFFIAQDPGFFSLPSKLKLQTSILYLGSWLSGLLLSAFFWMPAWIEKKYTFVEQFLQDKDFHSYFLSPAQLLHQNWSLPDNAAPAFWGVTAVSIFAVSLWQLYKKRTLELAVIIGFLVLALFMTANTSAVLWENIPFLPFFQLPWRFLSLAVWATALLVPFAVKDLPYRSVVAAVIVGLLLFESFPSTQVLTKLTTPDSYFTSYPGSTTWHEEGTPIWTAGSPASFSEKEFIVDETVVVTQQDAGASQSITTPTNTATLRTYSVTATQPTTFVLQHLYFPGWKAYVNNQETPIEFQDIEHRGLMKIALPAGSNHIEFRFEKTTTRLVAELISIGGVLLLVALLGSTYLSEKMWKFKT